MNTPDDDNNPPPNDSSNENTNTIDKPVVELTMDELKNEMQSLENKILESDDIEQLEGYYRDLFNFNITGSYNYTVSKRKLIGPQISSFFINNAIAKTPDLTKKTQLIAFQKKIGELVKKKMKYLRENERNGKISYYTARKFGGKRKTNRKKNQKKTTKKLNKLKKSKKSRKNN